jgi:hypothetical protein
MILTKDIGKALWTVFTGKNLVTHWVILTASGAEATPKFAARFTAQTPALPTPDSASIVPSSIYDPFSPVAYPVSRQK